MKRLLVVLIICFAHIGNANSKTSSVELTKIEKLIIATGFCQAHFGYAEKLAMTTVGMLLSSHMANDENIVTFSKMAAYYHQKNVYLDEKLTEIINGQNNAGDLKTKHMIIFTKIIDSMVQKHMISNEPNEIMNFYKSLGDGTKSCDRLVNEIGDYSAADFK